MSNRSSQQGRLVGPRLSARKKREQSVKPRRLFLESLEARALLTTYTYPLGATPDDTGEYMLGDVAVNVVLMESDPAIYPNDNGSIQQLIQGSTPVTINYVPENWDQAGINAAKAKVTDGLQWWEDTLANMFPKAAANSLDFKINWTYADNPVHTGYEPIARSSNDLIGDSTATGPGQGWLYDFLHEVGFGTTGNYSADMRAFNDYTRQQANADWAFTIFVVNDDADVDGQFSSYGSLAKAYSIPGGEFVVTPAGRPTSTYSHEVGHQFWALDEYFGGSTYSASRGYYNTQNVNAEDNPQLASINEIQTIKQFASNVTGGTFTLSINLPGSLSFTTAPIAYNASAAAITGAINGAANANHLNSWASAIGVTGGPLTSGNVTLTYNGNLVKAQNIPMASINGTGLTGGGGASQILETRAGRPNLQQASIMSTDHVFEYDPPTTGASTFALSNSFNNHTLDPYTMAMIGWKDSDDDGIFDVLDVPFTLSGSGQYDPTSQLYSFRGSTKVNSLPNQNPVGTQNDITINQITEIQAQIDNGPWFTVPGSAIPARTYSTSVSVDLHVNPGAHTVRFRSIDTRTGVKSNVFQGDTEVPTPETLPGLTGVVYVDKDGDGRWENGESTKAGASLEIKDQNGAPLSLTHRIEPNDYTQNWILNSVDSDATLSVTGADVTSGDVIARTSTSVPAAGMIFSGSDILGNPLPTWTETQKLKVTFASPVGTVSLKAYGVSATGPSYGRLDAFNASGQIVARYSTNPLANGNLELMTVDRTPTDIKYVIAYGRMFTEVVLDSLSWGPPTQTETNSLGAYSFEFLPNGTYHVQVTLPGGYHFTSPSTGDAVVVVSGGVAASSVNFGIAADVPPTFPFHNSGPNANDRYNVNKNQDSVVTALDALIIINYINARTGESEGSIPLTSNPDIIGYIDVVADGVCAANDVLAVINYINSHPEGEAEGEATVNGGATYAFSNYQAGAEGEGTVNVPQNAAEYFAQRPLHLLRIPGKEEPCMCSACTGAQDTALTQVAQSLTAENESGTARFELPLPAEEPESLGSSARPTLRESRLLSDLKTSLTARASIAFNARKQMFGAASEMDAIEKALEAIARDVIRERDGGQTEEDGAK